MISYSGYSKVGLLLAYGSQTLVLKLGYASSTGSIGCPLHPASR